MVTPGAGRPPVPPVATPLTRVARQGGKGAEAAHNQVIKKINTTMQSFNVLRWWRLTSSYFSQQFVYKWF